MGQNEAKKAAERAQRIKDNNHERQLIQDSLDRAENREAAAQMRLAKAQAHLDAAADMFNKAAGKADRDREHAEVSRIERDEKKHTLRTDAYYLQRDRARERQRQNMIGELDRQTAANGQRLVMEQARKKAERDAIQESTRRAMDADLAKAAQKKAEEVQLQQDLRVMMAEKEQREGAAGIVRPPANSTMKMNLRSGNQADLSSRVDASRHISKPLGRAERGGSVPLDASPGVIRRLTKDRSFTGEIPVSSILGGLAGT